MENEPGKGRKRMGIEPSLNTFLDEDLPDHSLGYVPFASV